MNQAKEKLNEPTLTESQHESLKKLETKVNTESKKPAVKTTTTNVPVTQVAVKISPDRMVNTESEKPSVKTNTQVSTDQTYVKTNSDIMASHESEKSAIKGNVQSVKKDPKLPQTSDNKVEAAVLTGFGVVISMFGLVGTRRKKN